MNRLGEMFMGMMEEMKGMKTNTQALRSDMQEMNANAQSMENRQGRYTNAARGNAEHGVESPGGARDNEDGRKIHNGGTMWRSDRTDEGECKLCPARDGDG